MMKIKDLIKLVYVKLFPKSRVNQIYKKKFGRNINWGNPTEFNEKLRWIQFNGDTSLWSLLADKYRVRQYIEEKGFGEILVPFYGVWESAEDIDFDSLPDRFILKTNHGSGGIFAVTNKNKANKEEIVKNLQKGLDTPFGISSVEPHYLKIPHRVIAEGLLQNDAPFSSSIVDYKIFCFHGEPLIIGVYYDRDNTIHKLNATYYDKDWIRRDEWIKPSDREGAKDVPRPVTLDRMLTIARELCKPFPFVRFDLYESDGKVYFGEFTFTPDGCKGGRLNPEIFDWLGAKIFIP